MFLHFLKFTSKEAHCLKILNILILRFLFFENRPNFSIVYPSLCLLEMPVDATSIDSFERKLRHPQRKYQFKNFENLKFLKFIHQKKALCLKILNILIFRFSFFENRPNFSIVYPSLCLLEMPVDVTSIISFEQSRPDTTKGSASLRILKILNFKSLYIKRKLIV